MEELKGVPCGCGDCGKQSVAHKWFNVLVILGASAIISLAIAAFITAYPEQANSLWNAFSTLSEFFVN